MPTEERFSENSKAPDKLKVSDNPKDFMLFDLQNDPNELTNLGHSDDPEHQAAREDLREKLEHWSLRVSQRFTKNDDGVRAMTGRSATRGVTLGFWQTNDETEPLFSGYRGKVDQRFVPEDK